MDAQDAAIKPEEDLLSSSSDNEAPPQSAQNPKKVDKYIICPKCDKKTISESAYKTHVKKHDPPGGYCCQYCDQRFCFAFEIRKHIATDHTTIGCRLCGIVTFSNEDDYREHIKVVHNGMHRPILSCEKCDAIYQTEEAFNRHKETNCGSIRAFKCEHCDKTFLTSIHLKHHVEECHTGEFRFCCSYCGKKFRRNAKMLVHERTHTGEKPYKCEVCGKAFSHRSSLVTHTSMHTGVRLQQCRGCGSRFSCSSNLIRHRRSRPESCGRPEFDPPKHFIRKFISKIPALLNPNQEIKVTKVIKPDDQQKVIALKKDKKEKSDTKKTKTKTKRVKTAEDAENSEENADDPENMKSLKKEKKETTKTVTRKRRSKKKKSNSDDEEDEKLFQPNVTLAEDKLKDTALNVVEPRKRSKRQTKKIIQEIEINTAHHFSEAEDHQDCNNNTDFSDGDDDDYCPLSALNENNKIINIKEEKSDLNEETLNKLLRSTPLPMIDMSVKVEKDEEENYDHAAGFEAEIENVVITMDPEEIKLETSNGLDETEVILFQNEQRNTNLYAEQEMDTLDINSMVTDDMMTKCLVSIEDVAVRYPEIKAGETTIKVGINARPFFSSMSCKTGQKTRAVKGEARKRQRTARKRTERPNVKCKNRATDKDTSKDENKAEQNNKEKEVKKEQTEDKAEEKKTTEETYKAEDKNKSEDNDTSMDVANIEDETNNNDEDHDKEDDDQFISDFDNNPDADKPKKSRKRRRTKKLGLKTPWKCTDCAKLYYSRKCYVKHLKHDHNKTEDEINENLKNANTHLEDIIIGTTEPMHKCHICDKLYVKEKHLLEHIPKHGDDGTLKHKCPCNCDMYFVMAATAQQHAQDAHREQLWCEKCQKFMQTPGSLKVHQSSIHGEKVRIKEKKFFCEKCGWKFESITRLSDHVRSDCGKSPIYKCTVCGKSLSTGSGLKIHMKTHIEDNPFSCELCGKTFKIKHLFQRHMKYTHSGENFFKCHLCPKEYPYRSSLVTHMTVHTGIKPYMCDGCDKRFTCISNLQAHRRSQANTCGLLPLNSKPTHYIGVQNGVAVTGAKPVDYVDSKPMVVQEAVPPPELPSSHLSQDYYHSGAGGINMQNMAAHGRSSFSGSSSAAAAAASSVGTAAADISYSGGLPLNYTATNNMFLFYMDRFNN